MALFDRTIDIEAPPDIVWQEARRVASKGRITSEEPNRLLIATEVKLGYVYWLEEQVDGSTRLRHVIDTASKIHEAFCDERDPGDALDILASRTETPGRAAIFAFLLILDIVFAALSGGGALLTPASMGVDQMARIKKKAERAARRAK